MSGYKNNSAVGGDSNSCMGISKASETLQHRMIPITITKICYKCGLNVNNMALYSSWWWQQTPAGCTETTVCSTKAPCCANARRLAVLPITDMRKNRDDGDSQSVRGGVIHKIY